MTITNERVLEEANKAMRSEKEREKRDKDRKKREALKAEKELTREEKWQLKKAQEKSTNTP